MGKKDKKKKDPEKKAAIAAKKEAKAEKAALKRLKKELGNDANGEATTEDDFDSILASFSTNKKDITAPIVETLNDSRHIFPPTRANFSFTYAATSGEIFLFGGEYYNGVENEVYDDLFKFNPDARPNSNESDEGEYNKIDDISILDEEDNDKESSQKEVKRIGEWKKIISPSPTPPARCAHSAVFYNNCLYIFGGELATAAQFHHYRDFWKFDINKNTWEEVKHRGSSSSSSPSPRSGHRCVVWRHYMILFGGFYEALKETKWFQDLWIFDFATSKWTEMKYGKLAVIPEPRSAFSFGIHPSTDRAYLYGGFSKLKNPGKSDETKVHTDCWALNFKGLGQGGEVLDGSKLPTWERLKRKGQYPTPPRSGMGCVVHKQRLLLFGGVNDTEKVGHKLESVFYENIFAFEMEKKRWFEVGLKKKKDGGRRRKKKSELDDDPELKQEEGESSEDNEYDNESGEEGDNTGWDLEKLRSNMFAFIDGDGNIVYEKIEEEEEEEEAKEKENSKESNKNNNTEEENNDNKAKQESNLEQIVNETKKKPEIVKNESILIDKESLKALDGSSGLLSNIDQKTNQIVDSARILKLNSQGKPTAIKTSTPLPRINASLAIKNNTLYLYGGLLEVGDREITLDDFWCIDLQKREEWQCIWRGTMHQQVWKGVDSDLDDGSYVSTGDDKIDEIDEFYSENEDVDLLNTSKEEEIARKEARKAAKKEARKKEKSSIRAEIAELRAKLELDDHNRTPQMQEALADFYSRTSEYWNQQAATAQISVGSKDDQEALTNKEMKREGFLLAKERYEELKPAMERLHELEEMQTSAETQKKKSKSSKDKTKHSDGKKKDRRH